MLKFVAVILCTLISKANLVCNIHWISNSEIENVKILFFDFPLIKIHIAIKEYEKGMYFVLYRVSQKG